MDKKVTTRKKIKRTKRTLRNKVRTKWILRNKVSRSHSKRIGERCLEDIIISCYVDGLMKEKDKEMAEKHLTECNNCIDLLLLHKKVREDETHEAQSTAVKVPVMSID